MSYLVLARKYRPQSFQDLVGQEHVARTLTNAINLGRVHHAFLFTGARGVGKTSSARILAKALNCEKGPAPEPCNACPACDEITAATSVDVLEISEDVERDQVERVRAVRARRDARAARAALDRLGELATTEANLVEPLVDCARALCTEGEIVGALREVFGEYTETPRF